MPQIKEPRKSWFGLISGAILERSGPSRVQPVGNDVYANQPMDKPGDNRTVDAYDQAERQVKR